MNKIEVKDLIGLAQPAQKLLEIVSNAIGILYEPRKTKKIADAEAYKIKKLIDTTYETKFNGAISFSSDKIIIDSKNIDNEELRNLIINEVNRLFNENENIKRIADFAYEELKGEKEKILEDIDEDWKNNFFDNGRKLYSQDLQLIFGKILAGEIKHPGTYSKRLLGLLSNLSQNEAIIFNKISKYVLKNNDSSFIISDHDILKSLNISLEDIIILEEAGLINSNLLRISGNNLYEYKKYVINLNDSLKELHVYFLTKSGCQLENIINSEISLDYLSKIKEKYKFDRMEYGILTSKIRKGKDIQYKISNYKSID